MSRLRGRLRRVLGRMSGVASLGTWATAVTVAVLNLTLALSVSARWTSVVVLLAVLFIMAPFLLRGAGTPLRPRRRRPDSPPVLAAEEGAAEEGQDRAADDEAFDEDLELTMWVGKDAEGDRILEKRLTRPHQAIEARALTLISPYLEPDARAVAVVPDLTIDTDAVGARWRSGSRAGRGVVLFDAPVADGDLRWRISYPVPEGLWNPLRSIGLDVFRYDVRRFPMGRFTVRFVVDSSAREVFVQERNQHGTVSEPERDADGNLVRVWTTDDPAAPVKYEWDIRVRWGD